MSGIDTKTLLKFLYGIIHSVLFLIRLLFIVLEQYLKARSWRSVRFVCIYFLWSMVWFQLMEVLKWSLKYATFKFLLIKQDITFSISCTKIDTSLIPSLRIFFFRKSNTFIPSQYFFFQIKKANKAMFSLRFCS